MPALYKIFDEILVTAAMFTALTIEEWSASGGFSSSAADALQVNAADNLIRDPTQNTIRVEVSVGLAVVLCSSSFASR